MLGIQEGRAFFSSAKNANGRPEDNIRMEDNLPSLNEVYNYFQDFLSRYSSNTLKEGNLKRTLFENVKNNNFTLDLKLDDIYKQQTVFENNEISATPISERKIKKPENYSAILARALSERPLTYLPTIERVCYEVCETANILSDEDENLNYIQINLLNTFIRPTPIRGLLAATQERFVVVPGIIVQASKPQHKMRKITLQCRYCDHKMSIDVPLWKDKPQMPPYCRYSSTMKTSMGASNPMDSQLGCNGVLEPYVILPNECTFVDIQSLKMQELPEAVPTGDMPRHLQLNVTRYLCEQMIPGDRVYVHGVLTSYNPNPKPNRADGTNFSYLHVLGFQKYDDMTGNDLNFDVEERNELTLLAAEHDIHQKIFKSIAPELYGMDEVKKACACLLFGGTRKRIGEETKIRGDINMLMLGDPSVAKSQVLKFVNRCAPISVYTSGKGSSAAGLTAAVMRDSQGVFSLEGGAMVLADGGVVCIDEFDKMRDDDVVAIHEAMEQQTISISKAGITTMLNSRCAVIAAANPTFGSYDDSQDTTDQHDFKTTILSRFDIIFLLRNKQDVEKDTLLCNHIVALHASKHKKEEGEIPLSKLTRYIQYAKREIAPLLSKEARDSLRNFYVQTRAEYRGDKRSVTKKIPITLRQLESLIRLAESFARMELSQFATEKHVQMSIDLFSVSTAETAKQCLIFETMSPQEQKAVKQAEDAILGKLGKGQRASRVNLFRELQMRGFDRSALSKALAILIKKGELQERGDRSVRRP